MCFTLRCRCSCISFDVCGYRISNGVRFLDDAVLNQRLWYEQPFKELSFPLWRISIEEPTTFVKLKASRLRLSTFIKVEDFTNNNLIASRRLLHKLHQLSIVSYEAIIINSSTYTTPFILLRRLSQTRYSGNKRLNESSSHTEPMGLRL